MFGFVCPLSLITTLGKIGGLYVKRSICVEAGLLSSAFVGRRIVCPSTSGGSRPVSTFHLFWR